MEVIWVLLLSVCTADFKCLSQTVDEFNTKEQCMISLEQHESLPKDGLFRVVKFKCQPKGAIDV
jgi:hypothetical protein